MMKMKKMTIEIINNAYLLLIGLWVFINQKIWLEKLTFKKRYYKIIYLEIVLNLFN